MPNQIWTGDVTYIRIKSGWCYLAVVLDLYAQHMVGFTVSDCPDSMLTAKALQMAYHTSQTFAEARSAIIDYI